MIRYSGSYLFKKRDAFKNQVKGKSSPQEMHTCGTEHYIHWPGFCWPRVRNTWSTADGPMQKEEVFDGPTVLQHCLTGGKRC